MGAQGTRLQEHTRQIYNGERPCSSWATNEAVQVGQQTKPGINFCAAKTHGNLAFRQQCWLTFPKGQHVRQKFIDNLLTMAH